MREELKKLVEREIDAIHNIPMNGNIDKAVQLIYDHTCLKTGKVVVSGVGKAGHIGLQLSTTLSSTGTTACFISPLEAQHGDLGILQENDVVFAISNSGQTTEIVQMVQLAKKLHPGISLIVMTKNTESPLARQADTVVCTGITEEICPFGLTPTTSTTVMKIISDLIIVTLMKKINFTKEQYALRHHGGYLGIASKK